jgi:hypothetical protein
MSKTMKKRQFKKEVGKIHEMFYKYVDLLPTEKDREEACAWIENLIATSPNHSVGFGVLYDKMDEMASKVSTHYGE